MIVVTGAGGSREDCAIYRGIIEAQARKCAEWGYKHIVADLGGLGIGAPATVDPADFAPQVNGDSLPAATFKAGLLEYGFTRAAGDEVVCWLDADCIPLKPFNPLDSFGGGDAAVTLRPAPEIGVSYNHALDFLNSGVVWFRNSVQGRSLCYEWGTLSRLMLTDQGALNVLVGNGFDKSQWLRCLNQAVLLDDGRRVLVLDAAEWNSWAFPPSPQARILHFKRGVRYLAKDYLDR